MKENLFEEILIGLEFNNIDILTFNNKCKNEKIEYWQAEQFLYCKKEEIRFEWFIALYDAILKDDPNTLFRIFREAYCSSNNIYGQIKNSQFTFNLKQYLKLNKKQGLKFHTLMNEDEMEYYNNLPKRFRIFRGLSQVEHISKDYGISWSLSEEEASNYSNFDKNNVEIGKGGLVDKEVDKDEILTVFSVHGKKEIIYII